MVDAGLAGWCWGRLSGEESAPAKLQVWEVQNEYGKCKTHCQSQSMHMDTSLGQGVSSTLAEPKKAKEHHKKNPHQQIPGRQQMGRDINFRQLILQEEGDGRVWPREWTQMGVAQGWVRVTGASGRQIPSFALGPRKLNGICCNRRDKFVSIALLLPSDSDLAFVTPLACDAVCAGIPRVRMLETPFPREFPRVRGQKAKT